MGWWNMLSMQMLTSLSKHPAVQHYTQKGMHCIKNNPSMKKSVSAMSNSWAKTKRQINSSISAAGFTRHKSGQNGGYVQWVVDLWNKNKGRIMSFIAVNFMGIILFVQCGSALWAMLWKVVTELYDEKAIDRKEVPSRAIKAHVQGSTESEKQKPKEKISKAVEESSEVNNTSRLSSFTEDSSNEAVKHSLEQMENDIFGKVEKVDFSTSFQFRMGEGDSFTSSLDNKAVTGDKL